MHEILDEMPETWVRQVVNAIEAHGHDVADAHEGAIVINLTPAQARTLGADPGEQLIIGWTERAGIDWGIGSPAHVLHPAGLDARMPAEIADAVHNLLTTEEAA